MIALTKAWKPLFYHPVQNRLLRSKKRYKVVVAGRGSGKSELAKRYLVMQAVGTSNGLYFYVGPTLPQTKNIAWGAIKELIPPELIEGIWENSCVIRLKNGSEIRFLSGEKPHRLEGVQWNGGIIDECSDQYLHKLFFLSVEPALTHKKGWCWLIGVPKRKGVGAKDFRSLFDLGLQGTSEFDSFTWKSGEILPPSELELRKEHLAPSDYREQYEATWESVGGLVYPDFDPKYNVRPCIYHPAEVIIVGSDFNVNPMCWTLSHFDTAAQTLNTFAEIFQRDTITTKTLGHLYQRYGQHKGGWAFVGDATARSRKTSASLTDYVHIHNDERFEPKTLFYPKSNPPVEDRINIVNAAICNAKGERRVFIDPSCKNLIQDFVYLSRDEKGEPRKDGDNSHMTDAHGYVITNTLPMKIKKARGNVIIATTAG